MNDFSDFVPLIAAHFGLAPSTLLLLVAAIHLAAKFGSRIIPNDAKGALAVLRNACVILGVDPSSRVTSGVSVQDVAAKSIEPPLDAPVAAKIAADKGVSMSAIFPETK